MKYIIALLGLLILSGCAATGNVCNDGHVEGFFGDPGPADMASCQGHGGVDLQATYPGTKTDPVELIAVDAYNKFHNRTFINTRPGSNSGVMQYLYPPLAYRNDDCDVHARWVGEQLARYGISGELVIKATGSMKEGVSDYAHAAWKTEDGMYIDINFPYPLTEAEWLEFVERL